MEKPTKLQVLEARRILLLDAVARNEALVLQIAQLEAQIAAEKGTPIVTIPVTEEPVITETVTEEPIVEQPVEEIIE